MTINDVMPVFRRLLAVLEKIDVVTDYEGTVMCPTCRSELASYDEGEFEHEPDCEQQAVIAQAKELLRHYPGID